MYVYMTYTCMYYILYNIPVYMCGHMYVYMYTCMYIYIYIIYIYVYTHVYT
jgi:hypothetical protein